VTEALWWWRAG